MLQAVTIYRLVHVGSGKGDPDPASVSARSVLTGIPRRERPSLLSRISFSFPILDPSAQIFCESRFQGSSQIPYPINVANSALYFG